VKKLVNPSLPANYFQNAFEKIQLALSALFEGKQLNYRLEDLYRVKEMQFILKL
jgi:hypothetical protein